MKFVDPFLCTSVTGNAIHLHCPALSLLTAVLLPPGAQLQEVVQGVC
jgi:hypothetical protein